MNKLNTLLIICITSIIGASSVFSEDIDQTLPADDTFRQVTDEQEFTDIIQQLEAKRQSIQTLAANFQQTKIMMPFEETQYASGVFSYAAPEKCSWSFTEPDTTTVIIKDAQGYIISNELKQVQVFAVDSNNRFDFINAGLAKPLQSFFVDFDVKCFVNETPGDHTYLYKLTPHTEELSAIIESFEIMMDANTLLPQSIKLVETSGDITLLRFSDIVLNAGLEQNHFDYTIPPEYEVIDYRR